MKTKTITLYSFDELSDDAKKKAIENLRDLNVDHDWWDFVYDDFEMFAALFGVTLNNKKRNNPQAKKTPEIWFNGFYSQGSGSSFGASVDPVAFVNAIDKEVWMENYPKEKISFYAVTQNIKRVCKLISSGAIDCSCSISPANRESSVKFHFEWDFIQSDLGVNLIRVTDAVNELETLLEDATNELNSWLYKNLESNYDYLTSDEAIIESIKANEYTFTEHGKLDNS